jgi:pyruvate/2-oxoglutarate dehydrogenase complex dihydrolipoamide acyltransferase (E2) component
MASETCFIEPSFAKTSKQKSTQMRAPKYKNPHLAEDFDRDLEMGIKPTPLPQTKNEPAPASGFFENRNIIISLAVIIVLLICLIVWLMYREDVKIPVTKTAIPKAPPAPPAQNPPTQETPAPAPAPAPAQQQNPPAPAPAPAPAQPPPAKLATPAPVNHTQVVKTSTDEELNKVINMGNEDDVSDVETL